jgi:hypothetical protein
MVSFLETYLLSRCLQIRLPLALKTLLGNDLMELDKVLEDLGKLEGKEETSWMLIETLSHMSKRLKEQERRQQEQELLLPAQQQKIDEMYWIWWVKMGC